MKKLLGMPKDTFLPLSAVVAFFAMVALLMVIKKTTGRTYIGYQSRALTAPRRRRRRVRKGRAVPAIASGSGWRRRWDQMSGSSTYSTDFLQGRKMGAHFTVA